MSYDTAVLTVCEVDDPLYLLEVGNAVADLPVPIGPVGLGRLREELMKETAGMLADRYAAYDG
jgi:hypothetical protein